MLKKAPTFFKKIENSIYAKQYICSLITVLLYFRLRYFLWRSDHSPEFHIEKTFQNNLKITPIINATQGQNE